MTTGKTTAFTRWTFVGKVMSLLFNMLFRLVITFLPRSKCLLISWLQSPSAVILEPRKIKSAIVSTVSSSICHEVMGPDAMILIFWVWSFKPTFSLSSLTFIKRLFSSSSLSALRVVSSSYLRLMIFLPAVLIPARASSSPAFLMIYSAFKLYSRVTIYSLEVLLFLFETSLLFHVLFWLLLPDLHTGFSRGRSGVIVECESESCSVSVRLFATPWNSPGQNTGVGSLSFLQGTFPTQGSNLGLPHCRRSLYKLSHMGSPRILEWVAYPFSSRSSWPRNQTGVSCIASKWAIRLNSIL